MNIPPPDKSFLERHKARMAKRNPKQLWSRTCDCVEMKHMKHYLKEGLDPGLRRDDKGMARDDSPHACRRPFQTTWDPSLGECVYCKECFLEEIV